ncbi:MAG: hypothetical protein A3J79_10270 [Elusimicrobia bacterium RIFOXYB2_FULL_62_6]|nr:MAG: hypothetical protein A3J79_10270 [Elusimicrobia bacterium RIFOXYB2_FULL_62_6]
MKRSAGKTLSLDASVYSFEAVKLAAFVFSGRGVAVSSRGRTSKAVVSGPDAERLSGEFMNEVLNQQCRLDLAKKNSKIAGIITTRALLSALGETKK